MLYVGSSLPSPDLVWSVPSPGIQASCDQKIHCLPGTSSWYQNLKCQCAALKGETCILKRTIYLLSERLRW